MSRVTIALVSLLVAIAVFMPLVQARDLDKELFKAVAKGRVEKVRELLAEGADPLSRDKKGRVPAIVARDKGHDEIVRILEAAVERRAHERATKRGTVEALGQFLEAFPHSDLAPSVRERIDTLDFDRAKSADTVDAYERYLRDHADGLHVSRARAWIDDERFRVADAQGTVDAYEEYLSRHGEGTHAEQARSRLEALHFEAAEGGGTIEALRAYLERYPNGAHGGKTRELLAPLEARLFEQLTRGIDVNARGRWGETPLHEAALNGQADLVRALLSAGAVVDARIPRSQFTPLHVAAREGNEDVVAILIDHGADIGARTKLGDTPIKLADDEAVIRVLQEHGAEKGVKWYSLVESPPDGLLERCGRIAYDPYDDEWRCAGEKPKSPYE